MNTTRCNCGCDDYDGDTWSDADTEVEISVADPLAIIVTLRIPRADYDALRKVAKRQRAKPGDLARQWLRDRIEQETKS